MKLRATTGFDFLESPSVEEVVRTIQLFLDSYRNKDVRVLRANAYTSDLETVRLDVVLERMSYAEAEALIDSLAESVLAHLRATADPLEVEEREIELAPA